MRTSPSQLVRLQQCPRLWWFRYVRKLPFPETKPLALGNALHALCAASLSGRPRPAGWDHHLSRQERELALRLFQAGADVLRPRPGLEVEIDVALRSGEHEICGRIDCLDPSPHSLEVIDHKTASSARWLKQPEDLRTDVPMMLYAGYALWRAPAATEVKLRHNQFVEDDPRLESASVSVGRDEVRSFWAQTIVPLLRTADAVKDIEGWQQVPGHPACSKACHAYNGCKFAAICHGGMPIQDFTPERAAAHGWAPF